MKILYAIQATGNGHLARAEDIVPVLREYGDLDIFVSGAQCDISLPYEVQYRSKGLSFYFGKDGGVDLINTIRKNKSNAVWREIREFPAEKYNVVINDFESISAWAARTKNVRCVALSHQSALLSPNVPRPSHYDPVGNWILRNYAPADEHVGFHFREFDKNIFTPVIRAKVRTSPVSVQDHYTVYLPAYDDKKLLPVLTAFPKIRWHVFSKHARTPYSIGRLSVFPVDNDSFTRSLVSSTGVLCGAGFETPAEALYLGKKLMVVPMKKQYEQYCNAEALSLMGVPVLKKVKKKHIERIASWIESGQSIRVNYPDTTRTAVEKAIASVNS